MPCHLHQFNQRISTYIHQSDPNTFTMRKFEFCEKFMEILVLRLDRKSWHFADGRGKSFRPHGLLNRNLSAPELSLCLCFCSPRQDRSFFLHVEQAFPTGVEPCDASPCPMNCDACPRGQTHSDSWSTCANSRLLLGQACCIIG
jgi:hypothetical protein